MRDASRPPSISRHRPSQTTDAPTFRLVNRRALRPNATEIAANPRWAVRWTKTIVNLQLKDIANKLMDDLRAYEREHLTPKGITIGFAGDSVS